MNGRVERMQATRRNQFNCAQDTAASITTMSPFINNYVDSCNIKGRTARLIGGRQIGTSNHGESKDATPPKCSEQAQLFAQLEILHTIVVAWSGAEPAGS